MNDNPFTNRRPTELEDKAHVETVRHFAEDMKQFAVSRDAVKHLERDSAKTALAAIAASLRPPQGNPILTTDGAQWHRSVDLFDNTSACHRPITDGMEYAVLEQFPGTGRNDILNTGRDVTEVLKSFAHDLQQALQTWTEDMTAQVKEFLAEKYPGHDLARVAASFMHKFTTQAVSHKQKLAQSTAETWSRDWHLMPRSGDVFGRMKSLFRKSGGFKFYTAVLYHMLFLEQIGANGSKT